MISDLPSRRTIPYRSDGKDTARVQRVRGFKGLRGKSFGSSILLVPLPASRCWLVPGRVEQGFMRHLVESTNACGFLPGISSMTSCPRSEISAEKDRRQQRVGTAACRSGFHLGNIGEIHDEADRADSIHARSHADTPEH